MSDKLLTRDDAIRLLEEVVQEMGENFVYTPACAEGVCTYTTPDGDPSCGVGRVVGKVSVEHLRELRRAEWRAVLELQDTLDGEGDLVPATMAAPALGEYFTRVKLSPLFDEKGWRVLTAFQRRQDARTPYRIALDRAIRATGGPKAD